MKRRAVVAALAALAALRFIKPKSAKALISGPLVAPGPSYVTVTRGTSQAVIQVLTPTDAQVSTIVSGGPGYDYYIDGIAHSWTQGLSASAIAGVNSTGFLVSTNGQWHIVFQVSPTDAAGEIVTVIQVDDKGAQYVPMTLAQAHALAPQLFV